MSDTKDTKVTNITAATDDASAETDALIVSLQKPIDFEGQHYTKIDLRGLRNIGADDVEAAERYAKGFGTSYVNIEWSLAYTHMIAARVSKMPIEFFKVIGGKDAIQIKNTVAVFLTTPD